MSIRFCLKSLLVGAPTLVLLGCRCPLPPAGTMEQQQASAVIHDPFPQNDIAPYDAGSRPPGYERPLPEPVRSRIVPDSFPWLAQ